MVRRKDPGGLVGVGEILEGRDLEKMILKFCDKTAYCQVYNCVA